MDIQFGILGQTAIRVHGQMNVQWGKPRERAILAALLFQVGRRVPVQKLVEWVWADDEQPPLSPASTFHSYAGRIRKALRKAGIFVDLGVEDGAYRLDADRGMIDYFAFRELIRGAREHAKRQDHENARESARAAVALWDGCDQPLADLSTDQAENWRRGMVYNEWIPANTLLLDEELALGDFDVALQRLDDLQHDHGTDVGLAKRRLQALHAVARHKDAASHYFDVRRQLLNNAEDEAANDLRRFYDDLKQGQDATPTPVAAHRPSTRIINTPASREPSPNESDFTGHRDNPPSPPAPGTRCQLPPDLPDFVGRESLLARLDELITTADGRPRAGVLVLDGLAGSGKTALAVHWAYRQLGRTADNAIYLDLEGFTAGSRIEAPEAIDQLLYALDFPVDRLATPARRAPKLRELVANTRTLIVLDNVQNSAHVRQLLSLLPGCQILLASRRRLTGLITSHGVRHCTVPPLHQEDAAELLTNRIGRRATDESAAVRRLVELCGGLPLALQLVAHHIDIRQDARLIEFVTELQDLTRLLGIGNEDDDPHANLRATFSLTYHELPEHTQRLFRLLGLPPTPEISLHAAAALAGWPVKDAQHHLDILANAHLVSQTKVLDRYRMHDLLHGFAVEVATNDDFREEHTQAELRFLSFHLHTTYRANRMVFPFRTPVPMIPEEEHVLAIEFKTNQDGTAWLLRERVNLNSIIPWAAERGYHDYAWRLPHNIHSILRRHGHYDGIKTVLEIAISSAKTTGNLDAEGASRNSLGMVHLALNEYHQSRHQFEIAASIARDIENTKGVAVSLLNLAKQEVRMGNLNQGEALCRKAFEHARKIDATEAESIILRQLADVFRKRKQCDKAITLYQQSLWLAEKIEDPHGKAEILAELGATFSEQDEYSTAEAYCRQSLQIVESIYDLEVAARTCNILAEINYKRRNHRHAIEFSRQAIRLASRARNATVEAEALHTLGHTMHDTGHKQAASEGWEQARAIYSDLEDHDSLREVEADLAALAAEHYAATPPPRREATEGQGRGPQDGRRPPGVFVSYTHDSERHKELVLEFCTLLRSYGIDAHLDQWFTDGRRDWYAWAIKHITESDFVIVVASPGYRRAGDGTVPSHQNRGIQSEASLLRDLLHSDRGTWLPKLLPVLLPGYTPDHIPLFLQPYTADYYTVTQFDEHGAEDLLRVLTAQPGSPVPPLGAKPMLPPRSLGTPKTTASVDE